MKNNFNPLAPENKRESLTADRLFSIQLRQGDSILGGGMKSPNFEDYLIDVHAEQYVGLDDDMPDAFDDWIAGLGSEDFTKYANRYAIKYGKYLIEDYKQEVLK